MGAMNKPYHFFAYLSKMRWIYRWGMKRNAIQENIMEHSFEVAVITHALVMIARRFYNSELEPDAVAMAALYHDCSEVLTGDLPSPIKYHNQQIRDAYKEVERTAEQEMLATLPDALQELYAPYLLHEQTPESYLPYIKAADVIAALIKCKAEILAGNKEFSQAMEGVSQRLRETNMPEVDYFVEHFMPSFDLTLDELITRGD